MELATAAQMKRLDKTAIEARGIPSLELMERAAEGLALAAEELAERRGEEAVFREKALYLPESRGEVLVGDSRAAFARTPGRGPRRAAVLCGPGNNGGDGVACARLLARAGWEVRAVLVGDREKMTPDTAAMERRLAEAGLALEDFPAAEDTKAAAELAAWCAGCDVLVDALFGIGLRRGVEGPFLRAVALLCGAGVPVLSADIASGVETDTGRVLGAAVRAHRTVTFTMPKVGQFAGEGALRSGAVTVHDIGLPPDLLAGEVFAAEAVDAAWVRRVLPERKADGHKGDFGKALLLAGSVGYTGAPVLAARAAVRGGCGLVFLGVPADVYPIVAGKCLEEMPFPLPADHNSLLARAAACGAVLIGPGLGRSGRAQRLVLRLTEAHPGPLVLDADGINALEGHMDSLESRRGRTTVLTPHDGEFARLGGDLSDGDRVGAARRFAEQYGCVLVLKGHRTITATPDGVVRLNTTGNSGLAKGGSGDVLAGLLTALLAQGLAPADAAAAAVWLHGRAGDLCAAERTAYAMAPGDLPDFFPAAFREALR